MAVPIEIAIQIITTIVLVVVVPIQVWMLRTILDLVKWRSAQQVSCELHRKRDDQLEKQVPVLSQALVDQGGEILEIGKKLDDITARLTAIDKRLDSIEKHNGRNGQ